MEDRIVFLEHIFLYNYKIFILLCIIFLDREFDIKNTQWTISSTYLFFIV